MNWHLRGVIEATSGNPEDAVERHFESCDMESLAFDRSEYAAGYREGITKYCSRSNGFRVGLIGDEYQDVCPEELEGAFLVRYDVGRDLLVADLKLRAEKMAFASGAAPSEFIGSTPSAEGISHRLTKFPQSTATQRALTSQLGWQRFKRSSQASQRASSGRSLSSLTNQCESAKKAAKKLGYVVDDVC